MGKKKNGAATEARSSGNSQAAVHREAVGKALQALGDKADVPALASYVRETLGVDITTQQVGLHRYHLLPKEARGRKKPGRRKGKRAAAANNGATPKPEEARATKVDLEDLRLVKDLIKRYGQQQVRELLDFLA